MKSIAKILKIVNIVLMVICGVSCFVGVGLSYGNAKDKKIQQNDLTMRITNITREIEPRYNTPTVTLEYAVTSKYKYSITGLNGTLDIYDEFNSNIFHASYTKINFAVVLKKNETQSGKFSLLCNDTDKIYTADFSTLSIRYTADYVYFEEINRNSSVNFNYDMPFTAKSSNTSQNNNSSDSSNTSTHTHSFTQTVTAPTCTSQGFTTYKCVYCDYTYKDDYVNPKDHNYISEVVSPTCTEQGYTLYTCSYCNDTYKDDYVNPKDHNYIGEVVSPTCTEQGYTLYTCSYCNNTYKDDYVNAIGHSYEDAWTYDEEYHWHKASCGHDIEIKDKAQHIFESEICSCGYDISGILEFEKITDKEEYEVVDIKDASLKCVYIPDTYNGLPVTNIADGAFYGNTMIKKVVVGNKVEDIGKGVFQNCTNLKYVIFKENSILQKVGDSAFNDCDSLTEFIIPDSVTSIGQYAFYGCRGLNSVTIPDYVTSIGNYAFESCIYLTSVTIGNNVINIGSHAFYYCSYLTSVTIGNNVTSIGDYAFGACSRLTSITIGNNVTSIRSYAFSGCSGLTSITIPDSVTSIGEWAFHNCSGLTSVTIGNGVTSIRSYAFSDCSGLTSITIPDSVTSIGSSAFSNCIKLRKVTFENTVGWKVGKNSLSSDDLANQSFAAEYLKSTYADQAWEHS